MDTPSSPKPNRALHATELDLPLLETMLDELPIGLIVLDDHGVIQRFNRYEEQLSGRRREESIGRSFFSEVAPCTSDIELGPKFHEGIEQGNLDLSVEFSFPFPYNRVPRDVHIRARSVRAGERLAHVVLIEDITSRKQLERSNAEILQGLQAMLRGQGARSAGGIPPAVASSGAPHQVRAVVLHADIGLRHVRGEFEPATFFELLAGKLRQAEQIVQRHGGRIEQSQGDGVVAYFLEQDGKQRTVFDAVRAAQSLCQLDDSKPFSLPFRVALAQGVLWNGQVSRAEFGNRTTIGQPLSHARLLAQMAQPGELLVTGQVHEAIAHATDADRMDVRGFSKRTGIEEVWRMRAVNLPQLR